MGQSGTAFNNAQADRNTALGLIPQIQNPQPLNTAEQNVVNQLQQAYLNQYQQGITSGLNQNIFNQNLNDSLSSLAARGVLNSTFGQQTLGNLYGQRASLLAQAANEAATQGLNMSANMLQQQQQNNMNLFNTMYSGGIQQQQLGGNMSYQTTQAANAPLSYDYSNRMNTQNVANQNAMMQYNAALGNYSRNSALGGGIGGAYGSIGGATIGAAAGMAIPGMQAFTPQLMTLGSTLGGKLGSTLGAASF